MQRPRQKRFTAPDGINLVAEVAGPPNATTVVLLHGGGQTRHSWAGTRDRLTQSGYQVISYDARGHGQSDWSLTADYSLTALAADLGVIVADIHQPIALVGASMGGLTAFYALGSKSPRIAEALVMVDIVLKPVPGAAERLRKFMASHSQGFDHIGQVADALAVFNPRRKRSSDLSGLRKNLRLHSDGRLYWHWDPRLLETRPTGASDIINLHRVSRQITVPTLLVRGSNSDMVDNDGVAEMRALVPQTEIYEVEGAGHMVVGDKNDDFNEGIISFLKRNIPLE